MRIFAEACERVAGTAKKLEKTRVVAEYFESRSLEESSLSAVYLCGRPFPAREEATLQVGGRSLWGLIAELSEKDDTELQAAYRLCGDLGAVAERVLPDRQGLGVAILEVDRSFRQIAAARGPTAKSSMVRDLLLHAAPIEAKYIIKIMTGDLRIGLKESLVEEAIARAYGGTLAEVQRANMLVGDIGETLRLAADGRLPEAKMRLFHPLGFMLASPIESVAEGLSYFGEAAVEDKYDGIRAQAHVSHGAVKVFSRTRDEITESFPELEEALSQLDVEAILDGEIVAWDYTKNFEDTKELVDEPFSEEGESEATRRGRARPFSVLQQRLGRKKVSLRMQREVPVAFLAFDVLFANGELLIDRTLQNRAAILDALLGAPRQKNNARQTHTRGMPSKNSDQGQLLFDVAGDTVAGITTAGITTASVIRAPVFRATAPEELEELFAASQARGNEGLMVKDLNSPYTPGRRGKSWLKMKRELATLDVVVTAVEYGHGKRIGVLSDYTFAVWDGDRLANIGKAYSGLTDAEIAEMTRWFFDHTIDEQGFRRLVEPKIVLEVAFNNMMRSDRHESGYALRFPRIVRLRPDKLPEEADTIETVRKIYDRQ